MLDGVDLAADQRYLLQASITSELTRLLGNGGLAPHLAEGVSLARLATSGIQLTDNNPTRLGRQIAQSVYEEIGHE